LYYNSTTTSSTSTSLWVEYVWNDKKRKKGQHDVFRGTTSENKRTQPP
jgi:hypothetical protein